MIRYIRHIYKNEVRHTYTAHLKDKDFISACLFSIIILCVSLWVSYRAALYATKNASNFVNDVILSNIPSFNVDFFYIYGPLAMWIGVAIILLRWPHKIPFTLKNISLFLLIRAVFINLTRIGPFPTENLIDPESFVRFFTTSGDLFFSAHTGLPFLMALVFWDSKRLRVIFILVSLFLGTIVLLGHHHYTIDVLSAFFITYTIYHIAQFLFKSDFNRFRRPLEFSSKI